MKRPARQPTTEPAKLSEATQNKALPSHYVSAISFPANIDAIDLTGDDETSSSPTVEQFGQRRTLWTEGLELKRGTKRKSEDFYETGSISGHSDDRNSSKRRVSP